MAKSGGLARDCSCISVIVSSYTWSCKLSYVLIAMLVSIQVASGCSILKNWGIHSIAESSTVHKVHVELRDRTLEGLMYFEFPAELRDQPHWYCDTFVAFKWFNCQYNIKNHPPTCTNQVTWPLKLWHGLTPIQVAKACTILSSYLILLASRLHSNCSV